MDEKKRGFWEPVLFGLAGTAVGYAISYYVNGTRKNVLDSYVDRAIGFLEEVRSRRNSGYSENKDI